MRVHDFEYNQIYSASVQAIREMLQDQFLSGAKNCYKHLGGRIAHEYINLAKLKESDSVEIWQDRIEIIRQDGIKTAIERVC